MAERIIWTIKAKNELTDILQYWIHRNKSNTFSLKLNTLIEDQLNLILEFPKTGRITDIPGVYKYLFYYEFIDDSLYVLTVRHGSQNPKTLELK